MRTLILASVLSVALLSAVSAQARPAVSEQPLPTPLQLSALVDTAIAQGGISAWHAKALRNQASDLVRLQTRYASDVYSAREHAEIDRRSRYLVKQLIGAVSKEPVRLPYAGAGPFPVTRGDITVAYATR